MAGIAETRLQNAANVARNQVGGSRRVAVVNDARDAAGLAQRGVERVQHALAIVQQWFADLRPFSDRRYPQRRRRDRIQVPHHGTQRRQFGREISQRAQLRGVRRIHEGDQHAQRRDRQPGLDREVAHGQNREYTNGAVPLLPK